jgi:hypothetical protein
MAASDFAVRAFKLVRHHGELANVFALCDFLGLRMACKHLLPYEPDFQCPPGLTGPFEFIPPLVQSIRSTTNLGIAFAVRAGFEIDAACAGTRAFFRTLKSVSCKLSTVHFSLSF